MSPPLAKSTTPSRGGYADDCACLTCRNFSAARPGAYPPEPIALFSHLGIDCSKESEAVHVARDPDGYHLYEGWFHFVGIIKHDVGGIIEIEPNFGLYFVTGNATAPMVFLQHQLPRVEFEVRLPWILDESYEE